MHSSTLAILFRHRAAGRVAGPASVGQANFVSLRKLSPLAGDAIVACVLKNYPLFQM